MFYLTTHSTHFIYVDMVSYIRLTTTQITREETRQYQLLTDRITHTTAFVTPVVDHWLEREMAQWVHPMKDRSDDPSHHERTFLPRSYISLQNGLSVSLNKTFPSFLPVIQVCINLKFTFTTSLLRIPEDITSINVIMKACCLLITNITLYKYVITL